MFMFKNWGYELRDGYKAICTEDMVDIYFNNSAIPNMTLIAVDEDGEEFAHSILSVISMDYMRRSDF